MGLFDRFRTRRPRYAPELAFPTYAHDPGLTAHPYKDDAGHSFGAGEPTPERLDPNDPQASQAWRYAFDLFNHGYFWEAHAWWEGLWNAEGREGPLADLLKALIRMAAAGVKCIASESEGARQHFDEAAALIEGVAATIGRDELAGLRLSELVAHCKDVSAACPPRGRHHDLTGDSFAWTLRPEGLERH